MSDWIQLPALTEADTASPGLREVAAPGIAGAGPAGRGPSRNRKWLAPHQEMYAAVWNQGLRTYWYRHDEALRRSYDDALAMRRDPVIHACLRRRQLPTSAIPHAVEPDDPSDPAQRVAARVVGRLVDRVPRFQSLKLALLEAIFYGRAAAQIRYGPTRVDGMDLVGIRDHHPVNGDKILRHWGGTPGILVNSAWASRTGRDGPRPWMRPHIRLSGSFGHALWLENRALRERFVVHTFEPTDTDYLYEGDLAGAVYGMGLRSRLWHPWNLRNEIASWALDALQKIGANGMLYGRFLHGNEEYRDQILEMLAKLTRDHIAAIPFVPGQSADEEPIRNIPVNAVGYDILATFQQMYEGQIREVITGENPAAAPQQPDTRKASELTEDTRMSYLRADAVNLQETLTDQLVAPLLRANRHAIEEITGRPVDYRLRLKLQIDRPNAIEDLQAAQLFVGICAALGIQKAPLDLAYLLDLAGLRPPEGGTIGQEIRRIEAEASGQATPPLEPGMPPPDAGTPPGEAPSDGGAPGIAGAAGPAPAARMPRSEAPADGAPPDLLQNLTRPTTNQGGSPGRYAADGRARERSVGLIHRH